MRNYPHCNNTATRKPQNIRIRHVHVTHSSRRYYNGALLEAHFDGVIARDATMVTIAIVSVAAPC
jgi:hypothetical protein